MKHLPILAFVLFLVLSLSGKANAQVRHFSGDWTKLETTYLFSFELELVHNGNKVTGKFHWTFKSYNKHDSFSEYHYKDKVGTKAVEHIRGTYDPKTKTYQLKGYKKEDPHYIIALDTYVLKVDGSTISGETNSNGSWRGRINGKTVRKAIAMLKI